MWRRSKSSASSPPLSLSVSLSLYSPSPITSSSSSTAAAAALGGERILSSASIYIHSPLLGQPPSFCASAPATTHTVVVSRRRGRQRLLSASPPVAAAGRPYRDHITSSALTARLGARCWRPKLRFLSAPEDPRSGAALWSRPIRSADAARWAHRGDAKHNKSTGVILLLR